MAEAAVIEDGELSEWVSSIEDADLKTSLGKFESQEKFFEAAGIETPKAPEPKDWRAEVPDELKKTADRFTSPEDVFRAIEDFRKRDSHVRVPGKDAKDEEVSAYHKAIGVPDKAEGYEFPEVKGQELTEEMKASRTEWGKRFHDLNISKDTAKALIQQVNEDAVKMMESQVTADKEFSKSQEDALRSEWKGGDYDKNKTLANRAFSEIAERAGLNLDDLTKIETKDGRFLMDRAEMLKIFSVIGREMAEGSLGPTLTDSERDTVEDQIIELRKQIEAEPNSKRKNQLYQKELALVAKMEGDKPIVGAAGRVA